MNKTHTFGKTLLPVTIIILSLFLCECNSLYNRSFSRSLPPEEGQINLYGISDTVTVKRDNLGIPFIEAQSLEDLVVAMGYVNAWDRFSQMEGFRLVGQGRLSEMTGRATLEMDTFMRAINVQKAAEILYESASPELIKMLQLYSDGVNAYLENEPLPATIKLSGHTPEQWKPIDSISVFIVLTLGLAQNLHQEIGILNLARRIPAEQLAWLVPVYPDEPLPFEEAKKLNDIDIASIADDIKELDTVISKINRLIVPATVASNNWAVSGKLTQSGKPIMANDTHLPLALPSYWHMMKLKCPGLEGTGVALPGTPGIVAGFNRKVGVGMTMVMADNQDLFLQKLKEKEDGLYYLYKGEWIKTGLRHETIRIKGEKDVTVTVHETIHGPLMNNILAEQSRHPLIPAPVEHSMGIAFSWAAFEHDTTIDMFFNIMKAGSVDEVLKYAGSSTSIIPLNLVMADSENIAWQVTGRFPLRKKGRGLFPSPGWTGEYDWKGFLDPSLHPREKNPARGYIGTANNRTVPADFPHTLSSSWHYPERAARLKQMIEEADPYTRETAIEMHMDTRSLFVEVIKGALLDKKTLKKMETAWTRERDREKSLMALEVLKEFDGDMKIDSAGAAFCGAFLHFLSINLFADECGGTDTTAWESLITTFRMSYSALHDHLTERGKESPFWNNVNTEKEEERHEILAQTILDAVNFLEKKFRKDSASWLWGDIHTYEWVTDASKLAPYMGFANRTGMKLLSGYMNRGPYPAPGDHTTLNVAGYSPGSDFDVWLIPAMRIIVDFGSDEPLTGINSSGQSDNPSSPHYEDGIKAWLNGEYQSFPFKEENIRLKYKKSLKFIPAEAPLP